MQLQDAAAGLCHVRSRLISALTDVALLSILYPVASCRRLRRLKQSLFDEDAHWPNDIGRTDMPECISSLADLQSLDLEGSGSDRLPASISALAGLTQLRMEEDRHFPPDEITTLRGLQSLNVTCDLPLPSLRELPALTHLQIEARFRSRSAACDRLQSLCGLHGSSDGELLVEVAAGVRHDNLDIRQLEWYGHTGGLTDEEKSFWHAPRASRLRRVLLITIEISGSDA